MAVLRGNIENNGGNIARIQEEMRGQEDRSGGVQSQIAQTGERVEGIEAELTQTRQVLQEAQQVFAQEEIAYKHLFRRKPGEHWQEVTL